MRSPVVRALLCTLATLVLLGPGPAGAIELDAVSRAAAGYTVSDPKLEALYRSALLETGNEITITSDGTAYVRTGDINAEWLRDASAIVRPAGHVSGAFGDSMRTDNVSPHWRSSCTST